MSSEELDTGMQMKAFWFRGRLYQETDADVAGVLKYFDDWCDRDPSNTVPFSELFSHYVATSATPDLGRDQFQKVVRNLHEVRVIRKRADGGNPTRTVCGLMISDDNVSSPECSASSGGDDFSDDEDVHPAVKGNCSREYPESGMEKHRRCIEHLDGDRVHRADTMNAQRQQIRRDAATKASLKRKLALKDDELRRMRQRYED
jgi:hypothetical protein